MDINLNADLGESFGAWRMGDDAALLGIVGSANVACGFHAGDPLVMAETVRLAGAAGVSLGAHPAFPDLQGARHQLVDQLEPYPVDASQLERAGRLDVLVHHTGVSGAKLHARSGPPRTFFSFDTSSDIAMVMAGG